MHSILSYVSKRRALRTSLLLLSLLSSAGAVRAQTTSFAYQGKLTDGGAPANGSYDLRFTLWDAAAGGTQQPQGAPVTLNKPAVVVSGGAFSVQLDFGVSAFSGADRFLEIGVRPAGGAAFTTLAPRQQISSTPYAIHTVSATAADSLSAACVGCVQDAQIGSVSASKLSGALPVASVPAGSSNYLQNTTTPQANTNFSISGDGTVAGTLAGNVVNATTQYSIGGESVLSNAGTFNLFAGVGAGGANTTGGANSFFGQSTGGGNTTGSGNSFFGRSAGQLNTSGDSNSFFGGSAGALNQGSRNSFFGTNAGFDNTDGHDNTFVGSLAGNNNTAGSNNTAIGAGADFSSAALDHATAVGSGATVSTSNTIMLGRGFTDNVVVGNRLKVQSIPLLASAAQVCFNSAGDLLQCGASSLRWKTDVRPFLGGLDIIRRLRPISFNWKEGGLPDIGLGAEDVARVAPSFVFTNKQGEVEGVKYERLNLLLINAVKEQQKEIEQLRVQVRRLRADSRRNRRRR